MASSLIIKKEQKTKMKKANRRVFTNVLSTGVLDNSSQTKNVSFISQTVL